MEPVHNIDDVIAQLDAIISWSLQNKNRMGYFAVLYRRMTVAVKQGIANHEFQDGARMEKLDVIFASRYFDAWNAYLHNETCSAAWQQAFDACGEPDLVVLQHLIMGVNTHINLDLCIAAADCCPGERIYNLQPDFEKINDIISIETQKVQDALCRIWPPLTLLTNIANDQEKDVLNFSIATARKCSWANAIVLAQIHDPLKASHISEIDQMVVVLGKKIMDPGTWMKFILKAVRMMEDPDVDKLIHLLNE